MAILYLITDEKGEGHLPYTGEDGKPDHHLMGAAAAALGKGYRGNKYEGPGKEEAITKLKDIYEKEGMDFPDEKVLVELSEPEVADAKLSEVKNGLIRIAVAYTGKFKKLEDGVWKTFSITASSLRQMAQRLAGRETPIDYSHNSAKTVPPGWDRAAGWFAPRLGEVEPFSVDPDTGGPREILYAWAEFTPACLSMIATKEYRYFSPEPHWNDTDEHGNPIKSHVACGAVTNRPFLKDLPPIEINTADYPQLLQMAALSESQHMLTMTPATAHVDVPLIEPTKESKTMATKRLKLKKVEEGEDKGQTGCFDESGVMVGLAEKGGDGKPPKMTLRLNKVGEHAGKVGVFDGDEMSGLADHRSMKSAMKALTEYDPSEAEDDPEEAAEKVKAMQLAEEERSNAVCLGEIAHAKLGEIDTMAERFAQQGKLTLPGLMKVTRIRKLLEDNSKPGNVKILPKQRQSFFILATANYEAVEALLNDMPRPQVDTQTRGIQGDGTIVDVEKEVDARIRVMMTENPKLNYGTASIELSKADTYLWGQFEKRRDEKAVAASR